MPRRITDLDCTKKVYTYVIGEDETFRFSETGASFFVDFASKHALHRFAFYLIEAEA